MADGHGTPGTKVPTSLRELSAEQRDTIDAASTRAAQLLGLLSDDPKYETCPECGRDRLDLKPKGAYCQACGANASTAAFMLHDWGQRCGLWSHERPTDGSINRDALFDASLLLLDHPPQHADVKPVTTPPPERKSVQPSIAADWQLFAAVTRAGHHEEHGLSLAAAQEFYGRHGISAYEVARSGSVMLVDKAAAHRWLRETFGEERLIACGLAVDVEPRPVILFNDRFAVWEPQIHPSWPKQGEDGEVTYGPAITSVQFRAGYEQEEAARDYKRRKAAGEDVKFDLRVSKFSSLRGAPEAEARPGFGAEVLAEVARRTQDYAVTVVEGHQDMLSKRTLLGPDSKLVGYGIPGTGANPPEAVLALLRRCPVIVTLDGDDAGRAAVHKKCRFLWEHGVRHLGYYLPKEGDITDALARRVGAGRPPRLSPKEVDAFVGSVRRWTPELAEADLDDGTTTAA